MKNTLLLSFLTLLLASCGNSTEFKEELYDPTSGTRGGSSTSQNTIGFEEIKNDIMTPHCIKCHANYSDYEAVASASGKIVSQVFQGLMPKNASPLSDELKNKLLAWYQAGSPEFARGLDDSTSSDDDTTADVPATITFTQINEQIMTPYCIQCHNKYDQYEEVFKRKDRILDSIVAGRMPKNGGELSQELKNLITEWVATGAPEGETDSGQQTPAEPELTATWDSVYKNIFAPKCVACHNPNGKASFLDLSTRQAIFDQRKDLLNNFENAAESPLIEIVTDPIDPMPPIWELSFDSVTEEEVKVLIEWIEKGLP